MIVTVIETTVWDAPNSIQKLRVDDLLLHFAATRYACASEEEAVNDFCMEDAREYKLRIRVDVEPMG